MRGKGDKKGGAKVEVHIHKDEVIEGGHHGGAWKVAYADFAMMAFFLLSPYTRVSGDFRGDDCVWVRLGCASCAKAGLIWRAPR